MRRSIIGAICLAEVFAVSGCTKPLWREMLGRSISEFTTPIRDNNLDKVWIKNMSDNECNRGCQASVGCCGKCSEGGVGGLLGAVGGGGGGGGFLGVLGGGGPSASSFDGLAYEVFSNYFTQKRKGRVVEAHRHNYATELNVETRTKIDYKEEGKIIGTGMSCEDLCLLDEAKKRHSDKLLAYQVIEMQPDEMLIHFRYSDVRSGMVELSRTLKVEGFQVGDRSF